MQGETEYDLVQTLGDLARRLEAEQDLTATLEATTHAAVATVPGADYAGISWSGPRRVTAQAPTHELVSYCDQLQSELGEGPCLRAISSQDTIVVDDLTRDDRWPAFAPRAAEIGVRSMISFRLFVESDTLGALNLYATAPGQFGTQARIVGELFASHAAMVLSGKKREDQLTEALATRDLIGQAKGLLMAREKITGEQAFQLLVRTSQDTNIKLVEVARWLVDEHENPGQDTRSR
ncbi:GAF domain-containing protein [Halopolyspora algeriensis]|uniref:GAF domain-containing protein n=1 Tax=Halopolyspora algeriensis TaxID=1500506 RepID=A0A368VPL4_9ACTN|nr:GAF and ANTAR domain-containing protein [Halopolyspora algeriensis]RCW43669.1 GAF domain-containing protein [Halopolyspora algeriensis]TQM47548.1 GAF domain-containing protein [Halopolyspora algeriensis]